MSRTRRRARPLLAALGIVACGGLVRVVGACSSFEATPDVLEVGSPDPRVDDGAAPVDAADAAVQDAAVVPYCSRLDGSLLCNEFRDPPITTGWRSIANEEAGTAEWTAAAGATEPGAGVFSTPPFNGPGNQTSARIYLSRGLPLPTATVRALRLEMAVRFDETAASGSVSVVRLATGRGTFYMNHSQLGYALTHSYDATFCPTPCPVDIDGTKPPIPAGTWDRLSITIEAKEAGAGSHIVFESASGERITAESPAGFTPEITSGAYLDVGFTQMTRATKAQVFVVDDVSLTVR